MLPRVQLHSSHIHFGFRENLRGAYKSRETTHTERHIIARICIPVQRAHMDQHKSLVLHRERRRDQLVFERSKTRFTTVQRKKYGRLLALGLSF
jgi:hypothetical protein